jgi:hypothetical protein
VGLHSSEVPNLHATRWFSRADCLIVLAANYAALCLYLQAVTEGGKWAVAAAVYDTMATSNAVAVIMAMSLLMGVMHTLSTELQRDGLLPHQVLQAVDDAVAELKRIQQNKLEGKALAGPVAKRVIVRELGKTIESVEPIECSLAEFIAAFDAESGVWMAWEKKGVQLSKTEPLDVDGLFSFITKGRLFDQNSTVTPAHNTGPQMLPSI